MKTITTDWELIPYSEAWSRQTEGKMTATINLIDYEIKPNDLITLLPGTIIQFRERTEKVRLCFAGFSSECVERINLIKSMVSSFSKITECPIVELQEDIASYLIDYFSLLARVTCDEKLSLPSEMTEVSLRSILTAVVQIAKMPAFSLHDCL